MFLSVSSLPCLVLPCFALFGVIKYCLFELHPRLHVPRSSLVCAPWPKTRPNSKRRPLTSFSFFLLKVFCFLFVCPVAHPGPAVRGRLTPPSLAHQSPPFTGESMPLSAAHTSPPFAEDRPPLSVAHPRPPLAGRLMPLSAALTSPPFEEDQHCYPWLTQSPPFAGDRRRCQCSPKPAFCGRSTPLSVGHTSPPFEVFYISYI